MPRRKRNRMGARRGSQLGTVASVLALLVALALPPAVADEQADAVQALQAALQEYRGLIAQISPDYLPGRMAGYPQTVEQLEKLGETLELLSRRAVALDRDGGDWAGLAADISVLRDDLVKLRRNSTVLRAYSHCIRAGIKRPRWAVAQVPSDSFVIPEVEQFDGNFSRYVRLQAIPGELLSFQLVAVPISDDIEQVEVRLPTRLRGSGGGFGISDMTCYLAATRSSPIALDEREFPDCPYRLRPISMPVRLPAELVQPFWFTLQVPEDAPAGQFAGPLVLSGRKVHSLDLEIRLTINAN